MFGNSDIFWRLYEINPTHGGGETGLFGPIKRLSNEQSPVVVVDRFPHVGLIDCG